MKIQTIFLMAALLLVSFLAFSQEAYQMKPNENYVEIDFLSSYYNQDGDNSAVTGGKGTEKLNDFSNIILVNIPIDSSNSLNFTGGVDIYSSASTDNIDFNKSSASSMDARSYINIGYTHKLLNKGYTFGIKGGFSSEYDYTSINGGFHIAKEFNNGNTEILLSGQAYIDKWIPYFPVELANMVTIPTTNRNSYSGQLIISQVINQRIQLSLSLESIYMDGLLSTPFHRVYFSDQTTPDIERLPSTRLKIPLAVRINYKPTDNLIIRSFYRYYTDDFGISAHTASLELPYHISDSWTMIPFYRYHTQTAADYFSPFATHLASETFYTSDFDLSQLSSNKFGLGMVYSPLYGLGRMKLPLIKKQLVLHSLSFRLSAYSRDTGLQGYGAAINFNMRI